jgi:hypothetical protein
MLIHAEMKYAPVKLPLIISFALHGVEVGCVDVTEGYRDSIFRANVPPNRKQYFNLFKHSTAESSDH